MKVILRPGTSHFAVYELTMLIDASEELNSHLRSQAIYQLSIPVDLVRPIQTEFSEICQIVSQVPS